MVATPFTDSKLLSIAFVFIGFGYSVGIWISRLAFIQADAGLNEADLGLVLSSASGGALLAYPTTLALLKKLKARMLTFFGMACYLLLLVAMSVVTHFIGLLIIFFALGFAAAWINAAINLVSAEYEKTNQCAVMSRLHALFSLGLAGASLVTLVCVNFNLSMLHQVLGSIVLLLFLSSFVYRYLPQLNSRNENESKSEQGQSGALMMMTVGALILFSTVIEGAMNDWTGVYLRDVIQVDDNLVPSGVLVFSIFMFIGRVLADSLRLKFNEYVLMGISGIAVSALLFLCLWSNTLVMSLVGFAGVGLFMSLVTPCIFSIAAKQSAKALTFVTSAGSLGALLGPALIGFVAHLWSLSASFYTLALFAFSIAVLALIPARTQRAQPVISQ